MCKCSWAGGRVVEWNSRWSPPFPYCPVSRQCPWKKILMGKNYNHSGSGPDRYWMKILEQRAFEKMNYITSLASFWTALSSSMERIHFLLYNIRNIFRSASFLEHLSESKVNQFFSSKILENSCSHIIISKFLWNNGYKKDTKLFHQVKVSLLTWNHVI